MDIKLQESLERQVVRTTSVFSTDESFDDPRFMRIRCAAMHTGINRNGSLFSKECIENAKDSFKNIPILANVIVKEDGSLDYSSHDMHIETDAFDEDNQRIIYDEKVVGIIPETNNFELVLDDETGNYYVYVDGLLYRDYGNYACDILEARGGKTDVSMEIGCDDISYNAKDKVLVVGSMQASALTLLGADVQPGMAKANAQTFSCNVQSIQTQMIELMQELKQSLNNYNEQQAQLHLEEGGNNLLNHFEELLEKYNKTAEDIDFDYESMNDDELDAKFEELFAEGDSDTSDGEGDGQLPENDEDDDVLTVGLSLDEKYTKSFALSHDNIRTSLYHLLESFEELDNEWYYIEAVYDNHFVYSNWDGTKTFGQDYTKDDETNLVEFTNDRYALYKELLTEAEKIQLEEMRQNYALLSEKVAQYEAIEVENQKMELLNSDDYVSINQCENFTQLVENHADITLAELKEKCDAIILEQVKAGTFAYSNNEPTQKTKKIFTDVSKKNRKPSRYGNLFSEK